MPVSIFILIGSIVVNSLNTKKLIKVNIFILFISVLSLLFDVFRNSKIIYMIMGGSLGTFYITYIYLMIHGLEPETRSKRIGLILLCVYIFKYITDYIVSVGGLNVALVILLIIYISIFLIVDKLKFEENKTTYLTRYYKTSFSFLLLLGTLIFISYFQVFLVGTDNKILSVLNQKEWKWLNQLVHLVTCSGYLIRKERINYIQLLYYSQLSIVFAFMLGPLPINTSAAICVFYNVYDALGDIFLFNLLGDYITKHRQKPLFLSLIALFMTFGVSGASYFVNVIGSRIGNRTILAYSVILVAFGFSLVIIPFLNRKIEEELYEINLLKAKKDEFTPLFTHSLKNIAVQMSCGIEVLKENRRKDNDTVEETLEIMSDSLKRMMKTVRSIDSYSRKIVIVREVCEMRDIVNAVLESIKMTVVNRKAEITTVFDEDTTFECDKEKVIEVFYNIIKNSYEAIESNSEGKIKIKVLKNNQQLICRITDNGTGISNKHINNILKPFYSTKKRSSDNYGLGLTYCNAIMMEHNGLFDIESKENVGTTVSLVFPVQK
jgi:signal transduction histidine kinase